MKKIGLFFGSFNPVHIGHMIIANYMATQTDLDQVWLVVSPHNPFKEKKHLANDYERLHMVRLAIGDNLHLKASDIEFGLSRPSYTVDTMAYLKEKYPSYNFVLLMGGDNLIHLHKWKNHEVLVKEHQIYIYKRPHYDRPHQFKDHPSIVIHNAPLMEISSTYIRRCLKDKQSIEYLVPDTVFHYLEGSNLYT